MEKWLLEVAGHRGSCGEDCFRGAVTPLLEGCSQPKATLLGGGQEKKHPTRSKLSIQKSNIMAYGPITSQQIDGGKVEIVTDFIFLGSKITADSDCSHEIKRHLLLGKKAETNLDSILKSKDIPLLTKVHLVKAIVFPVVMYGCESWTVKKAER